MFLYLYTRSSLYTVRSAIDARSRGSRAATRRGLKMRFAKQVTAASAPATPLRQWSHYLRAVSTVLMEALADKPSLIGMWPCRTRRVGRWTWSHRCSPPTYWNWTLPHRTHTSLRAALVMSKRFKQICDKPRFSLFLDSLEYDGGHRCWHSRKGQSLWQWTLQSRPTRPGYRLEYCNLRDCERLGRLDQPNKPTS